MLSARAPTLLLAGGATPRRCYERVAERARPGEHDHALFIVGDERMVPADDPRSNFAMLHQAWLGPLAVPAERVVRPVGDAAPASAAGAAERALRSALGLGPRARPSLDLALLGLGADGHTASLFPGAPALDEPERLFVATTDPTGQPRVTATFPLLDAAAYVVFLVAGAAKAEAVRALIEEPAAAGPASRVRPGRQLTFLLDQSAAGRLGAAARERAIIF